MKNTDQNQLNLFGESEQKKVPKPKTGKSPFLNDGTRERFLIEHTNVGEYLPLLFDALQSFVGVSDTPRFGVKYPAPKDTRSFYETAPIKQQYLSLGLEDMLHPMGKYLIVRVDATNRFDYIGDEPITNSNDFQIGSRLYFNHRTKKENRFGRKEKILSNGLIVVPTVILLDNRTLLTEIVENSKMGYHTSLVLHEQTIDGVYRSLGERTYIFDSAKRYFAVGQGDILFYGPRDGDGILRVVNLTSKQIKSEVLPQDLGIQLMAYWPHNPIFKQISQGLGNGTFTDGKFMPLEEMLEGKPLLLAFLYSPKWLSRT